MLFDVNSDNVKAYVMNDAEVAESSLIPHVLPMEIICEAFLLAAVRNPGTAAKLSLVCQSAHFWMLPALYSTVTLTSSDQIVPFARSLRASTIQVEEGSAERSLGSYVHHLWFGPVSSAAEHDLFYASTAWPVTLLHQILSLSQNLRALAFVNVAQHLLFRFEEVIPSTVESIYLGPVHGRLDISKLRCYRNLRHLTSMDTYMNDWEIQEIVTSPHLRVFRRFFSTSAKIAFAFDQLPVMKRVKTLERLEIINCDETAGSAAQTLGLCAAAYYEFADARILLTGKSNIRKGRMDIMATLYDDWTQSLGVCSLDGTSTDVNAVSRVMEPL
ncbi:uncharacterized protein LAESUDRAFT_728779 [Laetiporus sulphureus 93-53]|uniref:F-box domain-containing protein n=1 Tax=Laetiporus sulphureus 93-53 TaxID=1314785 RepID=A0A165CYI6_9APHY|nr:uncharacterized protein LAESUDRAFT_728779 [Laetiporus sulphureus 93-53]KZT03754.1 hypothetical protein LAESUDRAFT_728779 [Laetiporus sulphureus 93-53]